VETITQPTQEELIEQLGDDTLLDRILEDKMPTPEEEGNNKALLYTQTANILNHITDELANVYENVNQLMPEGESQQETLELLSNAFDQLHTAENRIIAACSPLFNTKSDVPRRTNGQIKELH
jgi:uncharacterized protein YoaH (UPF0181 family)